MTLLIPDMANVSKTFKARAAVIADQAHNPRGALGEGADFMRGLDENERKCESSAYSLMNTF
jgi:GINS complex subunit 3